MKILDEITPSEKERKIVEKIIKSVTEKIDIGDAKLELGGSYAKNTFLSGNHDIDIFVKFSYSKYKSKNISDELSKRLKLKFKRIHGSRDYFQFQIKGYTFELIPVFDIKNFSQAKNITDVSPLHKNWVKKHLKNSNDVRLIKKFCRAQNVYGAESYIKGFSGYVLEILTIYHGNFSNLIKNVSRWKLPVYVDFEKHYKSDKDAFEKINKSKRENDLIIVDPVQKDRNAAAAISREKIEKFIESCKNYLHNPSEEFFVEKKLNIKDLIAESGKDKLLIVRIKNLTGKNDVVGSKVLKVFDYLNNELKKNDFKVLKNGWYFNDESVLYYVVKDELLSKNIIHYGPPLKYKKYLEEFGKKYNDYKKSKGRSYVEIERKIKNLKEFAKKLSKDSYIKINVKEIKFKIL